MQALKITSQAVWAPRSQKQMTAASRIHSKVYHLINQNYEWQKQKTSYLRTKKTEDFIITLVNILLSFFFFNLDIVDISLSLSSFIFLWVYTYKIHLFQLNI